MAAQLITRASALGFRNRPIAGFFADARRAWKVYRSYRQTAAELRALGMRERADIGLAGEDMDAVARRAVYGA